MGIRVSIEKIPRNSTNKGNKKVDNSDPVDNESSDRYVKSRPSPGRPSKPTPTSSSPPQPSGGTVSQADIQKAIQQGKKIVRGLYDYVSVIDPSSTEDPDLNFKKGDVMEIIDEDGDWWLAVKLTTGEKGYVPNTYVALENSLNIFEWFHGKIGRLDAEKLLTDGDSAKGTFLIRESDTTPGTYCLAIVDVNHGGQQIVKHYRIRDPGNGGCFVSTKYRATSFEDLVKHHSGDATGICSVLTRACQKMQPVTKDLSRQLRDAWEIDRSNLEFLKVLGRGNFGEVWKGRWNKVRDVAIKTMKTGSAMTKEKFLLEADAMKRLNHPKLVQLFAVCTDEEPFYIVTELLMNGNLSDYLKRDKGASITTKILQDMALQIADGMKYIEAKNYIHRDLAARNILVGNPINMVKIGDFGLARAIDEDIYTSETGAKLPIRWTALEGITHRLFTIKSDVWAYGILLVEMFTNGDLPYSDLRSNREVTEFLIAGGRHRQPDLCPDDLYQVMHNCWHKDPVRRPTFEAIYNQIDSPDGAHAFHTSAGKSSSLDNDEDSRVIVSKKIEVDGINLSYDVTGTGKHRLFLLPGALGCAKIDFQYQMENMNKSIFTLIGWDPPGYGHSIPPSRSWPEHFLGRDAELAAKMMKTLGGEKFSLLGWSDGGVTALMVAARYPEIVQRLVVWGAAAFVLAEEIPVYEKIRNIDSWSPKMLKAFLKVYKEDYLRREFSNWVDAYTKYLTERKGDICQEELSNITCPTLILHGAKDPLVPTVHPEFLAKKIKNSQLYVYAEGKHNIHQRYFQEFNSTVEAFLTTPV